MTLTVSAPARLLLSHALAATAMSLPWPALLAQVWTDSGSDTWLGLTGAARMLPYVLLSALAGIVADRFRRTRVLRWSTLVRAALLMACAPAFATGQLELAVLLAVLTVAAGTPAYPAAVAVMPEVAGEPRARRYTDLLVTAEVTAFVVGPAIGGLLLGVGAGAWSVLISAVLALVAWPLLIGVNSQPPSAAPVAAQRGRLRTVFDSPGVPLAIAVVVCVNFAESAASVGLIGLSHQGWGAGDRSFGIATAALGFGSLAAPLLALVIRLRVSLLLTGGGFAAAGLAPGVAVAVGPLALAGAAGTVVECASTDVLQRSVPDHVRAFSLGLTDSAMVLAAALGAVVAPLIVTWFGPDVLFAGLGLLVALVGGAVSFAGRRSAGQADDLLHPEDVAVDPRTDHHDVGDRRDVGVVSESLAPVDVGDVDLDHR